MHLAIDPGSQDGGRNTGWAVLDATGVLVACGAGPNFPVHASRKAVLERPQIYRASKSKGDPNDLITLAICLGRYVERLESAGVPCEVFLPTTWKGQIDKDRHHLQVDAALAEIERAVVRKFGESTSKSRNDNVWDAVALAKWAWKTQRFAISRTVR